MTRPQIVWSWQISFGQVITVFAVFGTAVIGWQRIEHVTADHEDRITAIEATLPPNLGGRITWLEATANRNADRLNGNDVLSARIDARLARLEELMTDMRAELRNDRNRSQP